MSEAVTTCAKFDVMISIVSEELLARDTHTHTYSIHTHVHITHTHTQRLRSSTLKFANKNTVYSPEKRKKKLKVTKAQDGHIQASTP